MEFNEYQDLFRRITADDMTVYQNQLDVWQLLVDMNENLSFQDSEIRKYAMKVSKYTHDMAAYVTGTTGDSKTEELYWRFLKLEAPYLFESFIYYMEKNRPVERQFYKPREKTLHVLTEELQALDDGKYKFLGISLPPRVGKSTLCIFFLAWIMGKPGSWQMDFTAKY